MSKHAAFEQKQQMHSMTQPGRNIDTAAQSSRIDGTDLHEAHSFDQSPI